MRSRTWLFGCASLLALSGAAMAEEQLETVVITASKAGAQSILSAPISVQAISDTELKAKHITDIHDLVTTAVPGASEEEQIGIFIRDYAMRGSGAGGGIGDSMIGYYIDDTAWSIPNTQNAPALRLIDVERVEVLRGPYGTLYGSGAMGGIMIFHTKNPDLNRMTLTADAGLSTMQNAGGLNYTTEGAVSVPLVDGKLALRVSGGYNYQAGYASVYAGAATGTPTARHANDVHQDDLRAVLLWQPDDDFSARFQFWTFGGYQNYSTQIQNMRPAELINWGNIKGFEYAHSHIYSLSLNYDLDWATLTSATSYFRTGGENNYALFPTVALDQGGSTKDHKWLPGTFSFQQEVRLASNAKGPLHWVAGMYYQDGRSLYWYQIPAFNLSAATNVNTKNWSTFGEVSYDLFGGELVPLVGIRYFSDDRSFKSIANPGGATPSTVTGSTSPAVSTWRANLGWHPSDNFTMYFNAGTGFRSPIMQSQPQVAALQSVGINGSLALKPDSDISYELGIKGRLAAFNLDYATSVYWLAYKNFQTGVQTPQVAAFANLGTARTEGIDLELHWYPIEGLTLGFTGNINRSVYGQVDPSVAAASGGTFIARPGGQMLNTPGYSARFDVGYETSIGDGYTLYSNAAAIPTAKRINQYGVYSAAFTLFNASLGVRYGKYDVELFGENLSDERGPYYIRVLNSPKTMEVGPNPRTIGIRAGLNFD